MKAKFFVEINIEQDIQEIFRTEEFKNIGRCIVLEIKTAIVTVTMIVTQMRVIEFLSTFCLSVDLERKSLFKSISVRIKER